jgi:hypothetical protein
MERIGRVRRIIYLQRRSLRMDNKKLTLNPSDSQKLQSTTAKSIDTTLDVTRLYLKEIGPHASAVRRRRSALCATSVARK